MITILICKFYAMPVKPPCEFQIIVPVKTAPESLSLIAVSIYKILDGASVRNIAVSAAAHKELASDAR